MQMVPFASKLLCHQQRCWSCSQDFSGFPACCFKLSPWYNHPGCFGWKPPPNYSCFKLACGESMPECAQLWVIRNAWFKKKKNLPTVLHAHQLMFFSFFFLLSLSVARPPADGQRVCHEPHLSQAGGGPQHLLRCGHRLRPPRRGRAQAGTHHPLPLPRR